MEFKITFIAVLVVVTINFVLVFIWHTPLFGRAWGKETGYDPNMKPDKKELFKGMTYKVIGNFFFAWVLVWTMTGRQVIPGTTEMNPLANAIIPNYFSSNLNTTVLGEKIMETFCY